MTGARARLCARRRCPRPRLHPLTHRAHPSASATAVARRTRRARPSASRGPSGAMGSAARVRAGRRPLQPQTGAILSVVKTCAPSFQWSWGVGVPIHDSTAPRTPSECGSAPRRSVAYGDESTRARHSHGHVGSPRQYMAIGDSLRSREPSALLGGDARPGQPRPDRARAVFGPRSKYRLTILSYA